MRRIKLVISVCLWCLYALPPLCAQGLSSQWATVGLPNTQATTVNKIGLKQMIPANIHTLNFGFFCRQELKMQRANVPFAFRLGDMEQCNRLEQKPGYR